MNLPELKNTMSDLKEESATKLSWKKSHLGKNIKSILNKLSYFQRISLFIIFSESPYYKVHVIASSII